MAGGIQPTADPMGEMNQTQLNAQDISNLIDKVNELDNSNGINRTTTGSDTWYDKAGMSRIHIGQSLDDQRMGMWFTKNGLDVLSRLGG